MKKMNSLQLLVITLLLYLCASCDKTNQQTKPDLITDGLIDQFLSSEDFRRLDFSLMGEVDYMKSQVTYTDNDKSKPVINVVFVKNNTVIGAIEAIRNPNKRISLPNNGKYYMLLRDLREFDIELNSGIIRLIDLNYDNHMFSYLEYINAVAIKAFYLDLPSETRLKYKEIGVQNLKYMEAGLKSASEEDVHPGVALCDANNNGNMSYSECYACFNKACGQDPRCYTLCYALGDVVGYLVTGFPECQASIAAACVYLSIRY